MHARVACIYQSTTWGRYQHQGNPCYLTKRGRRLLRGTPGYLLSKRVGGAASCGATAHI
jgi:hypothetical protein